MQISRPSHGARQSHTHIASARQHLDKSSAPKTGRRHKSAQGDRKQSSGASPPHGERPDTSAAAESVPGAGRLLPGERAAPDARGGVALHAQSLSSQVQHGGSQNTRLTSGLSGPNEVAAPRSSLAARTASGNTVEVRIDGLALHVRVSPGAIFQLVAAPGMQAQVRERLQEALRCASSRAGSRPSALRSRSVPAKQAQEALHGRR